MNNHISRGEFITQLILDHSFDSEKALKAFCRTNYVTPEQVIITHLIHNNQLTTKFLLKSEVYNHAHPKNKLTNPKRKSARGY